MPRRHIPYSPARYQPPNQAHCQSKRKYPTEKQALHAADTQMLSDMQLELGVYKCPSCHKWHLTSRDTPPCN